MAPGSVERSGGVAHTRSTGLRTTLAVGLLVLGAGDLAAIDSVLLPRCLASRSQPAPQALVAVATAPAHTARAPVPAQVTMDAEPAADVGDAKATAEVASAATLAAQVAEQPKAEPPSARPAEDAVPPSSGDWPHLLFEPNSGQLSPESREALDRLATYLKQHATLAVALEGHTDDLGAPDVNHSLSRIRAQRAQKWLIAQGIDPAQIEVRSFGSTRPAATGRSADARAQNRRVEITVRERIH